MTVKISLIGLGKIGASIGLALSEQGDSMVRVGNDIQPAVMRRAKEMGAVDEVYTHLSTCVKDADIVILSLPVHRVHEVLESIAGELKKEAVLLETSPCKVAVAGWIEELFPPGCHYVGISPSINPKYLSMSEAGIEAARADMFEGGLMGITAPRATEGEAVKLAVDLTAQLGAVPCFSDVEEVDGILSATHLLPQLTAAALTKTIIDSPGWKDRKKSTGHPFYEMTSLIENEESRALAEASYLNRQHVIRALDDFIDELSTMRSRLHDDESDGLVTYLGDARKKHAGWLQERLRGDWISPGSGRIDFPRKGDEIRHMFLGVRWDRKK